MSSNLPNATVPSRRPGNTGKREKTNHKVHYMNLSNINPRPITLHYAAKSPVPITDPTQGPKIQ